MIPIPSGVFAFLCTPLMRGPGECSVFRVKHESRFHRDREIPTRNFWGRPVSRGSARREDLERIERARVRRSRWNREMESGEGKGKP